MARQYYSVRGSAFLWGTIIGVVVIILDLVDRFFLGGVERIGPAVVAVLRRRHLVVVRTPSPGAVLLVEGLIVVMTLLLFYVAGALAARRAHAVEAGIGAGVVAGIIVGVAHMGVVAITVALSAHPTVIADIVRGVIAAIVVLILGAGMGALGGLVGRGPSVDGTPAPTGNGALTPSPTATFRVPDERTVHTPTPYGPESNYPTAPVKTPSEY
jgi:hypothetical protein